MIFENNAIDLTGVQLLSVEIGETWDNFGKCITESNYNIFNRAFNLIQVSDEDTTAGAEILHILIDEGLSVTEQTFEIRDLLITNIIEIITRLGITIDKDQLDINSLPVLCNLVDVVYILDGYEDLLSLSVILEAEDIPNADRFIMLISKVFSIDDMSDYECLITDVSEMTLLVIKRSLVSPDAEIPVPDWILSRIKKNKEFFKGTLAWEHVTQGGGLGLTWETLKSFYKDRLEDVKSKDQKQGIKDTVALMVLTNITDTDFLDRVTKEITEEYADLKKIFFADKLVKEMGI